MDTYLRHKKVLFVASEIEYINKNCIEIFKWLKEEGYEIHVVTNKNDNILYCDKIFKLPFKISKIKTYKFLKEILKENEYDFIQSYSLLGGILSRLAAKRNKAKVIHIADKFYKGSSLIKGLIYYILEKFLSKYTDILVTTNEEDYILAKKDINEMGYSMEFEEIYYEDGLYIFKPIYE